VTPAYSVSMLFPLLLERCRFQPTQKACPDSPTLPTHVLTSSYDRLSRSIPDDHRCSLTQVALLSQQMLPALPPQPGLQFLIQNT